MQRRLHAAHQQHAAAVTHLVVEIKQFDLCRVIQCIDIIHSHYFGQLRHVGLRINRVVTGILRGTHTGLQQMALAAASRPPHINTSLAGIA